MGCNISLRGQWLQGNPCGLMIIGTIPKYTSQDFLKYLIIKVPPGFWRLLTLGGLKSKLAHINSFRVMWLGIFMNHPLNCLLQGLGLMSLSSWGFVFHTSPKQTAKFLLEMKYPQDLVGWWWWCDCHWDIETNPWCWGDVWSRTPCHRATRKKIWTFFFGSVGRSLAATQPNISRCLVWFVCV